ncbi:MAG: sigma-70 family RNA polymerase sigma factor [bacterium]|nr:sigma-70 family RNA polymerase sigma factor [bacterium]
MAEDRQLVSDALLGDDRAFEQLLSKYLTPVYNFISTLTRDRAVAEDLAQETFIKVWKNLARFDRKRNFKTWLFAIAKNTTYDFFKKKKSIPFSFFEDEEGQNRLDMVDAQAIAPETLLEKEEKKEAVEGALKTLPEPYQTLLALAYQEDFSLSEISQILGAPYNTVKSRHQRALKLLKQAVAKGSAPESQA